MIGAALAGVTGEFLGTHTRLVLLPLFSYLIMIPIVAWWAIGIFFIYSMGTPQYKPGWMVAYMVPNTTSAGLFWYMIFGILWLIALVSAIT